MKITVWAVISCIPERGEPPVWPAIFATAEEAEAHAERELRNEWEAVGEWDEEENRLADYPGNWREANERLKAKFSDGSWGEYRLITQEIELPTEERASPEEIEAARNAYSDDDLEIDDDAAVSRADDGVWVSAWVFVPNENGEG